MSPGNSSSPGRASSSWCRTTGLDQVAPIAQSQESGDEFEAHLGFTNEFLVDGFVKGTDHEQVAALATAISDRLAAATG
jgi:hypothetical protein